MAVQEKIRYEMHPQIATVCMELSRRFGIESSCFQRNDGEAEALFCIETVWNVMDEEASASSDRLTADPTWAILRTMLKKLRGHTDSSLILMMTGNEASASVVARTVMEGAIDIEFILAEDRAARCAKYMASYVANERSKCDRWESSIQLLEGDARLAHDNGIAQKRTALHNYDSGLAGAAGELGAPHDPSSRWPSVFDRFKSVGRETAYRTEYAALCIETHNAAEDLLNQLTGSAFSNPAIEKSRKVESRLFGQMMVYSSTSYFFNACIKYGQTYDLAQTVEEGKKAEGVATGIALSTGASIQGVVKSILMRNEISPIGEKIDQNTPCPCGSGKKYKKCCFLSK